MEFHKKNTERECIPQEAKTEESFSAVSLLKEIVPLLNEYFFGEFILESGNLCANFPNGQKFKIVIDEEK